MNVRVKENFTFGGTRFKKDDIVIISENEIKLIYVDEAEIKPMIININDYRSGLSFKNMCLSKCSEICNIEE